jgi:hypothetical protein
MAGIVGVDREREDWDWGRDSQQNYFVYIFTFLMLPTQINNPKTSYVLMTR